MLFPPLAPHERFRSRRSAARRRKRLRRGALIAALLVAVALLGVGAQFVGGATESRRVETGLDAAPTIATASGLRPLPVEIRGIHVTMGLASLPDKLEQYLALERDGLTAVELDVKDEHGQIRFSA